MRQSRRRLRWLVLGLLALPALELTYVIAINGLLASSLGPRLINSRPELVRLTFSAIWSLIPGRFHARDLSVRIDDGNVQVQVTAEEGQMDINPFTLLAARTFTGSHVRGHGITVRLRRHLAAKDLTPAKLANLPEIAGFDAPPFQDVGPLSADYYDQLIGVRLADVDVHDVREVWIDEYRFLGELEVAGAFYVRPFDAVRVDTLVLAVRSGAMRLGARPIAEQLSGALALTLDEIDLRQTSLAALAGSSCDLKLRATLVDLGFVNAHLPKQLGLTLLGGTGVVHGAFALDSAKRRAHGTLTLDATRLIARQRGLLLIGNVEVKGRLVALDLDTGAVDFSGSQVAFTDLEIASSKRQLQHYWGRVRVDPCKLQPNHAIVLQASADVLLKNLSPVVDVIHANLPLPGVARALLDLENVSLAADLQLGPRELTFRHILLKGGALRVQGQLALREIWNGTQPARRVANGILLLELGSTTVGLSIVKDRVNVQLLNAPAWYARASLF